MESSAKTGKKIFEGHWSTFCIKMPFGIGHLPPTHQLQSTCVGSRVPNLQMEFNYLNLFKSYGIFSDFVVPMVPTLSPLSPRHPHVILTSSPYHPCHPHIIPIAPRRSPCEPQGCSLCGLHPMLSPWSPHCPCCPHVVPVVPTSSPCHPHHPHIIPIAPRRSPWLWSPPDVVPMLPVLPTSSLFSPHCPCCPHIIFTSSRRFSHHPQPPRYPLHHPPPPWGVGGPKSVKMQ